MRVLSVGTETVYAHYLHLITGAGQGSEPLTELGFPAGKQPD
jgi:hypothetical protein